MCHNGSWNFAYRKTKRMGTDVLVEQCDICDDYRKRPVDEVTFVDADD